MRLDALAAQLGLRDRYRHLRVRHRRELGRNAGDILARQVELDGVDAVFEEPTHRGAHLLDAVHDHAEAEFGERQMRQGLIGQPTGHRDLLAGGEIARTLDLARRDRVADDHVKARLGGRGADAGGPAHPEIALGDMGAPQDVLLGRHALDRVEARLVVPGEMRVRLGHAGHQGGAGSVDHRDAGRGDGPHALGDAGDAVALDQHLAGIGLRTAAVDDADVGEQHVRHVTVPPFARLSSHRISSGRCLR